MRSIAQDLETHLLSGTTTLCHCWKVIRHDGTIQGFTDHDGRLSFDGVDYEAESGFVGSESLSRIGLSVDTMEVHSALSSGQLVEEDLSKGLYDNAAVELYLVNWQNVTQRLILKSGNIGEVRRGSAAFMAEIRGLAHNLQQPQGRLYQSTCDAELGDARCGVDLNHASYSATVVVTNVASDQSIETDGLNGFASTWFQGGRVEWLSGPNAGTISEVKSHQNINDQITELRFWQRLVFLPFIGDSFKITAGCDKCFGTCTTKFTNQANFRGFPHMPGNDFIISTPR